MEHQTINKIETRIIYPAIFLLIASVILGGCYYDNEEYLYPVTSAQKCDTLNPTYLGTIAPIFASNCNSCHASAAPSGNIVTDNHASLTANINKVWLSINHLSGASPMPQGGNKLTDCEIAKIKSWRNLGMPNN